MTETLTLLAAHSIADRRARCFDFRRPDGSSFYAFSLSWTPGTLTLAGDLGEAVITHYQALGHLGAGLSWAAASDVHYLLGKTERRQTFSREGTVRDIVRMANESAVDALHGVREELNDWRREKPSAATCATPEELAAETADWLESQPYTEAYFEFTERRKRKLWEWEGASTVTVAPDGWGLWLKMHERFSSGKKAEIFKAKHRRVLKQAIERHLGDGGPERAAELCMELGLDDYYGAYEWSFHDIAQMTAIRWAAARALRWLDGEKVYQWHEAAA